MGVLELLAVLVAFLILAAIGLTALGYVTGTLRRAREPQPPDEVEGPRYFVTYPPPAPAAPPPGEGDEEEPPPSTGFGGSGPEA